MVEHRCSGSHNRVRPDRNPMDDAGGNAYGAITPDPHIASGRRMWAQAGKALHDAVVIERSVGRNEAMVLNFAARVHRGAGHYDDAASQEGSRRYLGRRM